MDRVICMTDKSDLAAMMDAPDDDLCIIVGEYSIPHFADISSDSVLTQSQYAKVIFHDIADTYPTDADICCRYTLTDGVKPEDGDRVALYKVGWNSIQESIQHVLAPIPKEREGPEMQVLFKAEHLPKDTVEFYQLCYVKNDSTVCGASIPFQFRGLHEGELCEVEDSEEGILVVRTRTAVAEERLRKLAGDNETMQKEKDAVQNKLLELQEVHDKVVKELEEVKKKVKTLEEEKAALEENLESTLHVQRHVSRLQSDIQCIDAEKNQTTMKLHRTQRHLEVLAATVETLTSDKEYKSKLLREEIQRNSELQAEIHQLQSQVESLNHMLEVMADSKEMVANEMRAQQNANMELSETLQQLKLDLNCSWKREEQLRQQVVELEHRAHEQEQCLLSLKKEKQEIQEQLEGVQKGKNESGKKVEILEQTKYGLEMKVTELKLRLDLAAAEYKKLYSDKYRMEKKLLKLQRERKKQQESSTSSSSAMNEQKFSTASVSSPTTSYHGSALHEDSDSDISECKPAPKVTPGKSSPMKTGAKSRLPRSPAKTDAKAQVTTDSSKSQGSFPDLILPDLPGYSPKTVEWIDTAVDGNDGNTGGPNFCFICPFCSVTFPPGAYDLFSSHFDNHLC